METNSLNLSKGKKQSLEAWVIEILMPVLEAISFITLDLERQLQELE